MPLKYYVAPSDMSKAMWRIFCAYTERLNFSPLKMYLEPQDNKRTEMFIQFLLRARDIIHFVESSPSSYAI